MTCGGGRRGRCGRSHTRPRPRTAASPAPPGHGNRIRVAMKRGIAPGRFRKGKSTELQGHFLLVTLTGNVDLSSSVRLFNQAFDVAAQKRVEKILINALSVAGTLSTLERYALGVKVTAHITQLRTNPKVAFVGVLPTLDGF